MPYFGRGPLGTAGAGKLQPIHVRDVARAFADALEKPHTIHQSYDLAGPTVLTWPQLHHLTSQAILGRPRPALPIPAWYANLLTRLIPPTLLPFNRDQLIMSQEDNTCDLSKFTHDFGWRPADFESTLKEYAPQL
jgi:NADH dehydrogenase